MKLELKQGDITQEDTDAIVNAANQTLLGGGGVDGAIHRAAGRELLEACKQLPEVYERVRCPTGQARITPGFSLKARYVIHAVGPVYRGSSQDALLLSSTYRSALQLAVETQLTSVAFPAISCGVYGYPAQAAAEVARSVLEERDWPLAEVRFVLFSQDMLRVWQNVMEKKNVEAP